MNVSLSSLAKDLGFKGTLPKGSTQIEKDDSGNFKITVNGKVVTYKPDGSVFDSSSSSGAAGSGASGTGTGANGADGNGTGRTGNGTDDNSIMTSSGTTSGSGTSSGTSGGTRSPGQSDDLSTAISGGNGNSSQQSADLSTSWMNAGYDIDPARMSFSAFNLNNIINQGLNVPFGLGGMFSQNALWSGLMDFMKSVSFNFDFSQYNFRADGQTTTTTGTTSTGNTVVTTTDDGDEVTVADFAREGGYSETSVDGIYLKDGKYYKYDVNKKEFVKCSNSEVKRVQDADAVAARNKEKEEAKAKAADIAADLYDAMKGAGTKNQKLQQAVEAINKDNIIEIFEQWDELYADSMDGESLIESIQREHYTGWFGNSQEKQEEAIVQALFERAESIGLKAEAAAARAKVKSEHGSWFSSDGNVRAAILTLVEQIKAKEAEES